jgi:hypothetical protein
MEAATVATRRAAAPARVPSRKAPPRRTPPKTAPVRRPGGQLIPLAVGTAGAVRRLPDSGLMVRLTRGRAWIALLGVLLVGIVAVNVVTLSLAATVGHIDQNVLALEQENSLLRGRDAQRSGSARVRHDAEATLGLLMPTTEQIGYVEAGPNDVAVAAQRLAAAGPG